MEADSWDVGVRLAAGAQGRGLGLQAGRAALDDAFTRTPARAVVATAEIEHARCRRLFAQLRLDEVTEAVHPEFGTPHTVMRLARDAWEKTG